MQFNHQQVPAVYRSAPSYPRQVSNAFPFGIRGMQFDGSGLLLDSNMDGMLNCYMHQNGWLNIGDGIVDWQIDSSRENSEPSWHRMKWTDEMVKLLITAVSYIGDDALSDSYNSERKNMLLFTRAGKWRAISAVMVERGYRVSPQQCEDKFNDLNKKYKRLNDILGRGTACEVVENPAIMDSMNISDKAKGEVRKMLSCKQLFYQELCSYNNGNRLFLPHDHAVQQSLQLALKGKAKCAPQQMIHEVPSKTRKREEENEVGVLDGTSNMMPNPGTHREHANLDRVTAMSAGQLHIQSTKSRSLELKRQMLQIQGEMLELQKKRYKWLKLCQKEERRLEKMRLDNELMKLENEHLEFRLRCQEMGGHSG